MAKLDSLISTPVFMPLYRQYADTVGFPDASDLLERLGVHITDDIVELKNGTELTAIRSEITKLHPQTARWRQNLASN